MLDYFPREVNLTNYRDVLDEMFIEIGVTEMLPKCLELIARKLGKDFDVKSLKTDNATERNQQLPDAYRGIFTDANSLEYFIYEYAKSRIASQ